MKKKYDYYILEFPVTHNDKVIWEDGGGFIAIDEKPILDDELIYAVSVDWRALEYSRIYILVEESDSQYELYSLIKQWLEQKHGVTIGNLLSRVSKSEFDLNWNSTTKDEYVTPFNVKNLLKYEEE